MKYLGIVLISLFLVGCSNATKLSVIVPEKGNNKTQQDYMNDEHKCYKDSLLAHSEFVAPEGITEELRQTLILDAINSRYADCMGKKGWEQREF
jgi:hypothetical protein